MHASEFLWPLNSTKTLSSFRKLDQTTFKRLKCITLMSRFRHQKNITCGLSTSAGNLLTFFFAVCNNRPVRVIGRAGKRPEITVSQSVSHWCNHREQVRVNQSVSNAITEYKCKSGTQSVSYVITEYRCKSVSHSVSNAITEYWYKSVTQLVSQSLSQ